MARKSRAEKERSDSRKRAALGSKSSKRIPDIQRPHHQPDLALARIAVGSFLREIREGQRLSQSQVAAMTAGQLWRVSRPALSSVERGENFPNFETLMGLAKALPVDPAEIWERADLATPIPVSLVGETLQDFSLQAHDLALAGEFRRALYVYDTMIRRLSAEIAGEDSATRRMRADIEVRRAGALQRAGALLSADAAAKRAVSLSAGHAETQSLAFTMLAKIEVQCGFLPLAEAHARCAVETAGRCGEKTRGRALLEQGVVLHALERFEDARAVFIEARELLRLGHDDDNASHVDGNIGLCHAALGRRAEAGKWFARALELARTQRLPILEARWLMELGHVALDDDRLEEADRLVLEGLVIARRKDHAMSIFRGEWLRHLVVARRDPAAPDRQRLGLLRKLASRLASHAGERELQEFLAMTGARKGAERSTR